MHDAIHAQPDCIHRALASQRDAILRAAADAAARKRIWIAGIGTSFHAAMVADYCLRHFTRGSGAAVVQSFEFVHYPRELRADDAVLVISHRGWKSYSVQALASARAAGALPIAFTGHGGDEGMRAADHVIATCEQEQSAAHTKSYTSALACLALFAIHLAERRGYVTPEDAQRAAASVEGAPVLMHAALQLEAKARAMAAPLAQRARWLFLGAGPNWATAREGALKVKETSYLAAEGFQIEQFLHGPIAEAGEHCVVIAHLAGGAGYHRIVAALRAAGEVGALRVLIASHGAAPAEPVAEHVLEVPASGEWLSPLLHVVPVQLLAYYVALARSTNPDTCRRDHPAHARARQHFDL
jgi:glucosamine--fructose-6-phosphate aminotransferase (isomerizing)